MITPFEDKVAIKAILDTDSYITGVVNPQNIKTTKYGTDILNSSDSEIQIFIYMGTPEKTNSWIQKGIVYNIAVVGKRESSANVVDNIVSQIIAILNDTDIGRAHILDLLDAPLELDSDPAIYIVETTFITYGTVFNKIKT